MWSGREHFIIICAMSVTERFVERSSTGQPSHSSSHYGSKIQGMYYSILWRLVNKVWFLLISQVVVVILIYITTKWCVELILTLKPTLVHDWPKYWTYTNHKSRKLALYACLYINSYNMKTKRAVEKLSSLYYYSPLNFR